MPEISEYLKPESLQKLAKMEIVARLVVEGFITGMHKSPHRGFSVEFAEHRQYVPGDEIRHINWKAFARSDRYYIKQYEEETNLRGYILLDCSASMSYQSGPVSKFFYAKCLAAALSYLMLQQQDSAGLITFDREVKTYLPPRAAPTHLKAILHQIDQASIGKETSLSNIFHDLAERIKKRGLIIVISDLFDNAKDIMSGLTHFRHKKHEVLIFQVLDPDELNFPFRNWTLFNNLENDSHRLLTEPQRVRSAYLESLGGFVNELRRCCRQKRIDFQQLNTTVPFDVALAAYLAGRVAAV